MGKSTPENKQMKTRGKTHMLNVVVKNLWQIIGNLKEEIKKRKEKCIYYYKIRW